MVIRAGLNEMDQIVRLALLLWPSHTREDLAQEMAAILADEQSRIFIKYLDNEAIGFAQCQLRHDYVEGSKSSPVAFLEGIFVLEAYRHQGYARELLHACESWARDLACTEFASDCELSNLASFDFHMASGFSEVNRIICFIKPL